MNAKERFKRTRRAVIRLNEVNALIMYGCDDWKPPNVGTSSDKSDPTANRAIRNIDVLANKIEALEAEKVELLITIGESLRIIQSVREGFGEIYANLLDARYIDCWKWSRVQDEYGIPKSTGHYLIDIAFDWIDSIGVSRLLNGDSEL